MSYNNYDSDDLPYCDGDEGKICCELCGNCCEQEIVKLNDGDYIKYRCTDCLNDDDTIVIALEAAIGQDGICHKCGLDISNKPFSTDRPFIIGDKVLHWECLEDIIREVKLPDIINVPNLQEDSELGYEEDVLEENIPEYPYNEISSASNMEHWHAGSNFIKDNSNWNTAPVCLHTGAPLNSVYAQNLKCCEHAVTVPCVCIYSYKCKVHTDDLQVCYGSHS